MLKRIQRPLLFLECISLPFPKQHQYYYWVFPLSRPTPSDVVFSLFLRKEKFFSVAIDFELRSSVSIVLVNLASYVTEVLPQELQGDSLDVVGPWRHSLRIYSIEYHIISVNVVCRKPICLLFFYDMFL